jgi:hypothetical protein
MQMNRQMAQVIGAVGVVVIAGGAAAALAQAPAPAVRPAATTFRGCLQGDAAKGFALLSPGGGEAGAKSQMKTYKVVAATKAVELGPLVNKVVEVTGSLATGAGEEGKIPSPDVMGDRKVTDSNKSEPSSVADGMKLWADGTLTVRSVRQLENSCAARSDGK